MNLKFFNLCVMLSLFVGQIACAVHSDSLRQSNCVQMKTGITKVSTLGTDLISESLSSKDQYSAMNDVSNECEQIMEASKQGRLDIVKSLVKNCKNVNVRGDDGFTPLMIASLHGRFRVVEYLVNNGADVNIRSDNGSTAPQLAAANGHWEIVDFFQKVSIDELTIISPLGIILPILK